MSSASLATARSSATAASRPFVVPEQGATRDEDAGPGGDSPRGSLHGDPTVDLDARDVAAPGGDDHRAQFDDLRLHRREVVLAAETGIDGHHEDHVDEVEDVGDGVDGESMD